MKAPKPAPVFVGTLWGCQVWAHRQADAELFADLCVENRLAARWQLCPDCTEYEQCPRHPTTMQDLDRIVARNLSDTLANRILQESRATGSARPCCSGMCGLPCPICGTPIERHPVQDRDPVAIKHWCPRCDA